MRRLRQQNQLEENIPALLNAFGKNVTVQTLLYHVIDYSKVDPIDPQARLVKTLINHGAQVDDPYRKVEYVGRFYSFAEYAILRCNIYDFAVLLQHGLRHEDLLSVAIKNGRNDIARVLLENEVNPNRYSDNIKGSAGSPLHIAVSQYNTNAVKMLLQYGADVHAVDKDGKTPLHIAVEKYDSDFVKLLLQHGASRSTRNKSGRSPIDVARNVKKRINNESPEGNYRTNEAARVLSMLNINPPTVRRRNSNNNRNNLRDTTNLRKKLHNQLIALMRTPYTS